MSDRRLRELERRAAEGDSVAQEELERERRRARICLCRVLSFAGMVEKAGSPERHYLYRMICWTCGRIELIGSLEELRDEAEEAWGEDFGAERLGQFSEFGFLDARESQPSNAS